MLAETWEDILKWSELGYVGVEMEAATVFATSNSFKVPASAVLIIGDNLIEKETFEDDSAKNKHDQRMQISQDIFDAVVEEILRAN
jgi:uridine phosphorylase